MVVIVLITAVTLLKNRHITEIKHPILVDSLTYANEKAILVKGVVDNF